MFKKINKNTLQEFQQMSIDIYSDAPIAYKNWIRVNVCDDKKTGFYGAAYYNPRDKKLVFVMRGTEFNKITTSKFGEAIKDIYNDVEMSITYPNQYSAAEKFFDTVSKDFKNCDKYAIGHSLAGSLSLLLSVNKGCKAVTWNAYHVGHLVKGKNYDENKILNIGNINDLVFILNIDNAIGKTYITHYDGSKELINKMDVFGPGQYKPIKHHAVEKIGDLSASKEYKPFDFEKTEPGFPTTVDLIKRLSYTAFMNNLDDKIVERYYTRDEIENMSYDEYKQQKAKIWSQYRFYGFLPTIAEAEKAAITGEMVFVHSYTRADGTKVDQYYRRRPHYSKSVYGEIMKSIDRLE